MRKEGCKRNFEETNQGTATGATLKALEPKHTTQKIKQIALNQIEPGPYQRPTNTTQAANIANYFDEAKLGALTVSSRDGKFYLIDGAHRICALRTLGYTHAHCLVLEGLTAVDEAKLFRSQDKDKRFLLPYDFFKAGRIAGDEKCLHIDSIVAAAGLKVSKTRNGFSQISAVSTLFEIYDVYGHKVLQDALWLIVHTWNGLPKATQSASLLGVAEFVSRYGMAEFAERLNDRFTAIFDRYTDSLQLGSKSVHQMSRKKFCRILVEVYNEDFTLDSKRRLVWRDDDVVV